MQFATASTPAEVREASRLLRPPNFWLKFLGASWYASVLLVIGLGAIIFSLFNHEPVKWTGIAILIALAVFRFGIAWTRYQDRMQKAISKALPGPGTRTLEGSGVRTSLASGATSFVPWSSYNRWQEGKSIFVLTGPGQSLILPVDDTNRDALRGFLQSNVR